MAHFTVAKWWLCFVDFSLLSHLQIVDLSDRAREVVQNSKAAMDCGRRAGECEVVTSVVSYIVRMATIEKVTMTKCHVNAVIVFHVMESSKAWRGAKVIGSSKRTRMLSPVLATVAAQFS